MVQARFINDTTVVNVRSESDTTVVNVVSESEIGKVAIKSTGDHSLLTNRDLPNQHPMESITGLTDTISNISSSVYDNHEAILELSQTKVDKVITENIVYGTDENGDQTTYNVDSFGQVDDVQVGGVSVVTNKIAELGTMAVETAIDYYTKTETDESFATAAQGDLADTAIQPLDNITELTNNAGYITASDVKDGTLTIQKNGTLVGTFTANQAGDTTVNLIIPTTASDVGALPDTTTINNLTTPAQQAALNSGATSTNIAQIATNTGDISTINGKIPSAATPSNQLADKDFVNSSIATNTANFIGTFNSVAELEAYSGTVTNNDYAFVIVTDSAGNTAYDKYKYTTATTPASWQFEYELNNSSFTAAQWAAINSGANTTNIGQITTNQNAIGTLSSLNTTVKTDLVSAVNEVEGVASTALQPLDNISSLTNDSGFITGITSTDVTTALGFTPYDSSNPAGYTTNEGTVTSVNNTDPVNGNVTISIPTDTSDLTNGAGFITGITSSDVTTALGYTPANDSNVVKTSGDQTINGDKTFMGTLKGEASNNTNHALLIGHANQDYMNFYEYGGEFNFYKSRSNTNTLLGKVGELTSSTDDKTLATTEWVNDKNFVKTVNNTAPDSSGNIEIQVADLPTNIIDVVGTYAELQSYVTTGLADGSIVEVMVDSNNNNKHSYYRWSEGSSTTFVQPVLTADGTIGGDAFACAISSLHGSDYAWHAFDGVTAANSLVAHTGNSMPSWFEFYNPEPICVTKMTVVNGNICPRDYQFQASTDGTNWTTLVTATNQYSTDDYKWYSWSFDVPNSNYYKYYRFYVTSGAYMQYCSITEFTITATLEPATPSGWTLIASEGVFVPTTRTVNNKALSSDITLTASDVGAYADNNPSGYITSSAIANMQTTTNLVTSVSSSSTDSQYPSALCLYTLLGDVESLINAL